MTQKCSFAKQTENELNKMENTLERRVRHFTGLQSESSICTVGENRRKFSNCINKAREEQKIQLTSPKLFHIKYILKA